MDASILPRGAPPNFRLLPHTAVWTTQALAPCVFSVKYSIPSLWNKICGAISYMHKQRVMHRDLKPANIFLTLKGQVRVE